MAARGQGTPVAAMKDIARRLRSDIITMLEASGSGHPGGSLSAIDILTALWFHEMRHKVEDPKWAGRDRFILSKGHGVPALYAVWAELGYIRKDELGTLRRLGSRLQGHPDRRFLPAIEGNTGSLGQGISLGIGMCLGLALEKSDARVYCLIGDGETDEGQIWEAALWAGAHGKKMGALCVITDVNRIQNDTFCDDELPLEPLADKWKGMGWNVIDIDGHDIGAVVGALESARACTDRPTQILCRTVKGKGVSFMENQPSFHGAAPSKEQAEKARAEIAAARGSTLMPVRSFEMGPATRDAYGDALCELGGENPLVVALDADLSKSTKSGVFGKKYPDRYWNIGIQEMNMVGMAAGLASTGRIPFISSFAVFLMAKGFDQLRMNVAYANENVKVCGSHGGLSIGEDGPSQMGIEDVALACLLPGFIVTVPADAVAARSITKLAAAHVGPVYIRTGRPKVPLIYREGERFTLGKAKVHGAGGDVCIVANGLMVAESLKAADLLREEGIDATVLDMHTVKPLDEETLLRAAKECGAVVTAEEHLVQGALGAAVAQCLARRLPVPMEFVGVQDTYAESGPPQQVLDKYGLNHRAVADAARKVAAKKGGGAPRH